MGVLDAFESGAGISAGEFSLLIRIGLLSVFLLWAAWCVLKLLKFYREHQAVSPFELMTEYVRVFFLVAIVVTLVFVR